MTVPTAALEAYLDRLASGIGSVERTAGPEGPTWSAGGIPVVVVTATAGAEFRLDPAVAAAAARTTEAGVSARGPEWVRFGPTSLDRHATDRLDAWFALAVRRATESPGRR